MYVVRFINHIEYRKKNHKLVYFKKTIEKLSNEIKFVALIVTENINSNFISLQLKYTFKLIHIYSK